MNKNNGSYQELLHGEDDGLKDMDGVIDYSSSNPFPSAFCDEEDGDLNTQQQQPVVVKQEGGEIYHLLNHDDDETSSSMFYNDFPPLPDFPCMSSSSSSSSAPVLSNKPVASTSSCSSASSSSATSWTVFKPESDEYTYNNSDDGRYHHHHHHHQYHQYHHHHHHQSNDYIQDPAAAAGLSSTASMEISLPPPDDVNNGAADDCINVMENFGYMDLLDSTDIWDPSSIFETESENPQEEEEEQGQDQPNQNNTNQVSPAQQQQQPQQSSNQQEEEEEEEDGNDGLYFLQGNRELGDIFLEWLKQNKDYISAEDMRSIKLKRSTVDCALKRLGTTKEGKKQLLKLILEWVEQYQLQKKRAREQQQQQFINPNPNPNVDLNCNPIPSDPNHCFSPSPAWAPPPPPPPPQPPLPPPCVPEAASVIPTAFPPVMGIPGGAYPCDIPYSTAAPMYPPASAEQYQQPMDATQSWSMAAAQPFTVAPHPHYNTFQDTNIPGSNHAQAHALYVNAYPYPVFDNNTGERLVRLGPSATREARKKRMARHRRVSVHHYHRHHHQNHHRDHSHHQIQQPQDMLMAEQQAVHAAAVAATGGGGGVGGVVEDRAPSQANPNGNWVYWPPAAVAAPPVSSTMALVPPVVEPSRHMPQTKAPVLDRGTMQSQSQQQQRSQVPSADRKQGLKTEKNLKFLLQKVLKQSDVGNLGRIVLPKKEAETHLPELESRDGICLAMEDIGTSNVWNMRYRFWPNNKSRMYLLENTGDFVRVNGLQEGDFIVIYSDTKCGKYLIRGVKVRQPGSKPEAKKPAAKKNQRNVQQTASNISPASFKTTAK
ncbi:OLC1v1006843C1 [Oldenlandia corymbosa var. corymbosa]|uniref:OLC1v1006843C1 n=1 Tax=Oldenlandia corymbosa var. corymbosa TaxID=529605 RepID=A0AAV1DIG3_OLDCO|nr:OLC1v1006843C1 [Oldenlandia corymbosa var. corymbosa]